MINKRENAPKKIKDEQKDQKNDVVTLENDTDCKKNKKRRQFMCAYSINS